MQYEPIKRNRYSEPPFQEGKFSARNFDEDFNEFHLPLNRMQLANFQEWGVAQGLEVSGSIGGTTLTIAPGVAVDLQGQLISLSLEGKGDIGSNPPSEDHEEVDVPIVLELSRFAQADDAAYLVTIQFSQILRFEEGPLGRYEHAPWVRLQSVNGLTDDGISVILARVVINSDGELRELQAQGRRLVGKSVQELLLRRPQLTGEQVEQLNAGKIAATENGLQISVTDTEKEVLLSQENGKSFSQLEVRAENSIFRGALKVSKDLQVGDTETSGSLSVTGNANIGGNLTVSGNLEVTGDVTARDVEHISGNVSFGDADNDEVKITGVLRSGHTSGALRVDDALHSTGSLTIDGRVGIGTTSPERSLHIRGDTIRLDRDASNPALMITRWSSGYEKLLRSFIVGVAANNTSEGYFFIANRNQTVGGAGEVKNLVITQDGNVGIGTTSPSAPLQVQATNQTRPDQNGLYIFNPNNSANQHAILSLQVAGPSGGDPFVSWDIRGEGGWTMGIDNSDGNKLKIARRWESLTTYTSMTLARNGNVGIGTTNPQAKLHVNGDIQIQNGVTVNNINQNLEILRNDFRRLRNDFRRHIHLYAAPLASSGQAPTSRPNF